MESIYYENEIILFDHEFAMTILYGRGKNKGHGDTEEEQVAEVPKHVQ